jgi:hypothetical protein
VLSTGETSNGNGTLERSSCAGTNFSSEKNPSPESHPGLKCTRIDAILNKLVFKINQFLK